MGPSSKTRSGHIFPKLRLRPLWLGVNYEYMRHTELLFKSSTTLFGQSKTIWIYLADAFMIS